MPTAGAAATKTKTVTTVRFLLNFICNCKIPYMREKHKQRQGAKKPKIDILLKINKKTYCKERSIKIYNNIKISYCKYNLRSKHINCTTAKKFNTF